jgi:hypothetical protein
MRRLSGQCGHFSKSRGIRPSFKGRLRLAVADLNSRKVGVQADRDARHNRECHKQQTRNGQPGWLRPEKQRTPSQLEVYTLHSNGAVTSNRRHIEACISPAASIFRYRIGFDGPSAPMLKNIESTQAAKKPTTIMLTNGMWRAFHVRRTASLCSGE